MGKASTVVWLNSISIDATGENTIVVMIEYRGFMTARVHHQRAALVCTVIDENTHSENIVVGGRIKCPVLVPVHLGIRVGVLEV